MSSASTFDEPVIDYDELAGLDDIGTYPIDPSPSSLLPSGISVETVARLTHDNFFTTLSSQSKSIWLPRCKKLLEFRSKTTLNVVGPLRPDCSTRQVRANSGDLPLPHPRPTIRPAHYPEKVLWTLADCKVDAEVNSSAGNNDDDWKAMRQSAILIVRTCIQPLNVTPYYKYFTEQVKKSNAKGAKKSGKKKPRESTTQQAKVKKTFYKRFFFKEWFAALQELESAVPLMSLCAGYWKADMTLRSVLPDIRVDLPTPATSHSSRPPPAPRSQSSMPPPAPHVRSSVPSRTTRPRTWPVASGPATSPSPCPTPSDSSRAAASRSEPSARRDSSKAPQPSASCAPPAKKARTKGKRKRDPSPPPQIEPTKYVNIDVGRSRLASPRPAFLSIVKSGAAPLEPDQQTSRTTRAKSAMQAGDRATSGEEASADNVAARQWESSPLPPSRPTTPKPKCVSSAPTTPYTPVSYEESQVEPNYDMNQDNGNGDDEGDKHGDGESGSSNGDDGNGNDGNGNGDGLLATLKQIIKAIMAAAKSEHPSKEDVEEIIESGPTTTLSRAPAPTFPPHSLILPIASPPSSPPISAAEERPAPYPLHHAPPRSRADRGAPGSLPLPPQKGARMGGGARGHAAPSPSSPLPPVRATPVRTEGGVPSPLSPSLSPMLSHSRAAHGHAAACSPRRPRPSLPHSARKGARGTRRPLSPPPSASPFPWPRPPCPRKGARGGTPPPALGRAAPDAREGGGTRGHVIPGPTLPHSRGRGARGYAAPYARGHATPDPIVHAGTPPPFAREGAHEAKPCPPPHVSRSRADAVSVRPAFTRTPFLRTARLRQNIVA
ncbi:hypothetical protein EDB84DRAFT_1567932 [Lactarius hengduanensis]|nr:hypothetical protein EDB84DRAFT_1567932 [Lactarius hengduanensis]